MAKTEVPRLAILGAGPIGLEAALYAAYLQLPFIIFERGRVGEHLQQWGHVKLFSPFGMNVTSLGLARVRADAPQQKLPGDNDCISGKEHLATYLEPLARSSLLRERIRTEVAVHPARHAGDLAALAVKHPSTWAIWLARGPGTQPIKRIVNDPLRERDQLAVRANTFATRSDGNVEFRANAVVEALETAGPDKGFKVRGRVA